MKKNKNYIVTFIVGILFSFIVLWLLVYGRFLIGIFAGVTSIQILRNRLTNTNADNG